MNHIKLLFEQVESWIWGPPLLLLLLGTGLYLTFVLRGVQFRYLFYAFGQVFAKKKEGASGDISHFEALMTTLAGAIGTGAIVGVATAVTLGGFGALFWMWITALLGMATKYAESLLAVKYRVVDHRGEMLGGPMEYIERGFGSKFLAVLFAIFAILAAFGTGNLVQVNAMAESIHTVWHIAPWISGLVIAALMGVVVIGGVKSIGHVAGILVPLMALFYLGGATYVLWVYIDLIPDAFILIFKSAFTGQAAFGGFAGATMTAAIQFGVSRSVFSNEAGLGISSVAAAAAKTDSPGRQAMITMTGALMSTVIVCTLTGLVLAVTGVLGQTASCGAPLTGACMAIEAFQKVFPYGGYMVTIGLIFFAFTTAIAWAYYGEKCVEYLLGEWSIPWFRLVYCLLVIPGAAIHMELAWSFANIANALMAIPNLIAIIGLTSVIRSETKLFLKLVAQEKGQ